MSHSPAPPNRRTYNWPRPQFVTNRSRAPGCRRAASPLSVGKPSEIRSGRLTLESSSSLSGLRFKEHSPHQAQTPLAPSPEPPGEIWPAGSQSISAV